MCVIILHSLIYLLLTADCCLAQGIVKSFTKENIWIHANLNHNCMIERSFILFSFLFFISPQYYLIAFMLANLRETFQRAAKWMGNGYESATKWRGELSLLKHLNSQWWKKNNCPFNPSCWWAHTAGQIILKNRVHLYIQDYIISVPNIQHSSLLSFDYKGGMLDVVSPAHSVANRKREKGVNWTLSPWTSKLCTVPFLPKPTSHLFLDLSGNSINCSSKACKFSQGATFIIQKQREGA